MKKYDLIRKQCAIGMAVLMAVMASLPTAAAELGDGPLGPLGAAVQEAEASGSEAGTSVSEPGNGPLGPLGAGGTDQGTESGSSEAQTGTDTAGDQAAAPAYSEEEIDAYFDNSVMVGDSIMLGFRNYAMRRPGTWLSRIQFLAAGSYSTSHALEPVTQKSIHPMYDGQKRQIWESIALMGGKKVFLLFGMNDLNISGIEGTCENYKTIVANIKALSPDAEIHLISMTYVLRGKAKNKLNNDNIRAYNEALRGLAADNGWGYVDLAPHLADEGGDLAAIYCSDEFVHQTPEAYDVWCGVLREYAKERLESGRKEEKQGLLGLLG